MVKLVVNTSLLLRELQFAVKALDPESPLLKNVVFSVEDTHLQLFATDGLNAVRTKLILAEPAGSSTVFAVNGKDLYETLATINKETVTFNEDLAKVTLTAGKKRMTLSKSLEAVSAVVNVANQVALTSGVSISTVAFAWAIEKAAPFVSQKETAKYTMTGVALTADEANVSAKAMDGVRAIEAIHPDKAEGRNLEAFIPTVGIPLALGVIDVDKTVTVQKESLYYAFGSGSRMALVRRLVSENPPKISSNIDKFISASVGNIAVNGKELAESVNFIKTASAGKFRKVTFTIAEKSLKLHSSDPISGAKNGDDEIDGTSNGSGQASINGSAVLDFLKYVPEGLTFYVGALSETPTILTNSQGTLRYLVMQLV